MPGNILPALDAAFVREAASYLEQPSYLMRLADAVGVPAQQVASRVVPSWVATMGDRVLRGTMVAAAGSVRPRGAAADDFAANDAAEWTALWHRVAATLTGATGGVFGLAGLAVELPITTGIIFRSIASVADDFGEDLSDPAVRLECLTVFALGGPSAADDAMDSSYITSRIALAAIVREASQFVAARSPQALAAAMAEGTAPVLLNLVGRVAAQFNVAVSQKFLAQSLPVFGIVTGAALNCAFAGHFGSVARYHFGVRRLERMHGAEAVHEVYRSAAALKAPMCPRIGPGG